MKKAIISVIIAAALAASFAAGARAAMLNAQPVGPSGSGYVISYRFGPLWFNESTIEYRPAMCYTKNK